MIKKIKKIKFIFDIVVVLILIIAIIKIIVMVFESSILINNIVVLSTETLSNFMVFIIALFCIDYQYITYFNKLLRPLKYYAKK